MDKLDQTWTKLPILGDVFERLFAYFSKHTTIADMIHLCLGISLPLLILQYYYWAIPFLVIGLGGHVLAYIKGGR
ncbi:hypothetical protein HQ489_06125 [Candidatus Woesearchaeota archaeon]|nr:hypothetical protein [Candidatus Woesearchaeota archaeon]